jgi:hypothetical protein
MALLKWHETNETLHPPLAGYEHGYGETDQATTVDRLSLSPTTPYETFSLDFELFANNSSRGARLKNKSSYHAAITSK